MDPILICVHLFSSVATSSFRGAFVLEMTVTSSQAIGIREGVLSDVPFLDSLQKLHATQVGWMPTKQLQDKVTLGHVIIAEDESKQAVGYCIGND